jgi:undecaprenyl-diphosphatase
MHAVFGDGMRGFRIAPRFDWLDAVEARLCLPCNRISRFRPVSAYFKVVSRLGDGLLWYALLAALPVVYGKQAILPTAHMAVTALLGVAFYALVKGSMVRERPFASHAGVTAVTAPLDRYSFPSGHTLQAILFLTMLQHYFPGIALLLLPFCISVAASRVVLGLHYPSDVLAGALLGWLLAAGSLLFIAT